MFPNLDLEKRLQALERFMREIRGDRGATEPATWTPTWTGLTVVGALTTTGRYMRIGRLVHVHVEVQGATSTASTAGSTFVNNLPFISASDAGVLVTDRTATASTTLSGLIPSGTDDCYTPTWAANGDKFMIDGWYEV